MVEDTRLAAPHIPRVVAHDRRSASTWLLQRIHLLMVPFKGITNCESSLDPRVRLTEDPLLALRMWSTLSPNQSN